MTTKRKETELLKMINEMPEEWLESCYTLTEAMETEKSKKNVKAVCVKSFRRIAVKWAVAAALAVFLGGGGVAYAAKLGLLQFSKIEEKTKRGYSLTVETERIAAEELTGNIHEVEDFLREYMAEKDYSQQYPSWLKQFETVEDAGAYIGYAGMKATKLTGTIEEVSVRVIGDTEGNLGEVSLFVCSREDNIILQEFSAVFTEECPLNLHGTGIVMQEDFGTEYRSEEYITANGKTAMLVYEEKAEGNRFLVGAVTDGAVYYELSILYYPQDFERAKELMLSWCDQF